MKTVLVLSSNPTFAEGLADAIGSAFKVVPRVDINAADPILRAGLADICILDAGSDPIETNWALERLQKNSPQCPLIVYLADANPEHQEEAYNRGARYVLAKPFRAALLRNLLERSLTAMPPSSDATRAPAAPLTSPMEIVPAMPALSRETRSSSSLQALDTVRNFSIILTQSLNSEALLKEFLLLMRSVLGVNRAAIYLRENPGDRTTTEGRRLRSASAVGLSNDLVRQVDLSYETGIGGYLVRTGRILRRDDAAAANNEAIQKEFQVLGAQVAIPIVDRETMVGIALLDGRLTGEALSNVEVEAIFRLLEGLALAVRNIWLHDRVASDNALLAGVLRELSNGCVVVTRDLQIAHANKSARQYFGRSGRRGADLDFSDLPPLLGNKVYQVLNTGTALASFRYESTDGSKKVFDITILPLYRPDSTTKPDSVLLVAEDRTQAQQLQQLEVETANLRLVRTLADRLAHEIGNALVPLSTHQQLLADKYRDPEFRASLDHALADGVKRISRLSNQMRFLARDSIFSTERLQLKALIEEAYQEAQKHHNQKPAKLEFEPAGQSVTVAGDRTALKHAMAEVLLNALQANHSDGKIEVSAKAVTEANGSRWVQIAIEDAGEGFSPEAAKRVPEPFYTTRNVGLGLGLTVSRKIIEVHHGRLQIEPPAIGHHGLVRISLPLEADAAAKS